MTDPTDPIARAAALLNRGDAPGARALAEVVLTEGGDGAALRHLLGVACCQSGDLQQGVLHLQRAVQLAPRAPGVLIMLMRALIDIGRPRDALMLPFGGEDLPRPALLALWRTRAEAAHRAGEDRDEIDALQKVALLDPADGQAREMAVPLLVSMDRCAEALTYLDAIPLTRPRQRMRDKRLACIPQRALRRTRPSGRRRLARTHQKFAQFRRQPGRQVVFQGHALHRPAAWRAPLRPAFQQLAEHEKRAGTISTASRMDA